MCGAAAETVRVKTEDGAVLVMTHFRDEGARASQSAPLVILPALGTKARTYRHMAAWFAAQGRQVFVPDLRGTGESKPPPRRDLDWGFDAHLDHDLSAILKQVEAINGTLPILAGHSYGGHLAAAYLAKHPCSARALALLACAEISWRLWGAVAPGILLTTQTFAVISRVLGYFPGQHLGWGCPIARTVILDWARWCRSCKFRGTDGTDYGAALAGISAPVLSVSFEDDRRLGRRSAVHGFASRFKNAELSRWHLSPQELSKRSVGHFGFLREAEPFWVRLESWLAGAETRASS